MNNELAHEVRINVKVHGLQFDTRNASESEVTNAQYNAEIRWWEHAEQIAEQLGYYGVHADGRQGGWFVAYCDRFEIDREAQLINEIEAHLSAAPAIFAAELEKVISA